MNYEIDAIKSAITDFMSKNYPHMTHYKALSVWANSEGMTISIMKERLLRLKGGEYFGWIVQFNDPEVYRDVLPQLQDFMSNFIYKPICDPEFGHDGIYDTGTSRHTGTYARCWFVPEFQYGHIENGVLSRTTN